ncbi:MAG: mitochondrial fission ELM1 family protein [Alphaproteobacteria bacterium]|nr:mitochondrial fission ELM1 family protein [Alphaproteobacteria bacterium]
MQLCWILTEDGLTGTENQCLGVAEALGIAPQVKRIKLRQPWKTLSPWLGFEQNWSFTPSLIPPWPDLLICGGRKAIAAARYIKRQSQGKTFTVFLQDPRINPAAFDLVAAPAHDPVHGPNVIKTIATPNRITPDTLAKAKEEFEQFKSMPAPRVAVLIGGNSKAYKITPDITHNLASQLASLNTSLMITTSRRTGEQNTQILKNALSSKENVYFWDGSPPNPYFGMLAWADYILATADSASMLSEACTTGKPVYMIELEGGAPRIKTLHKNLQDRGALKIFNAKLEHWTYEPLNDAQTIAQEIRKRMKL